MPRPLERKLVDMCSHLIPERRKDYVRGEDISYPSPFQAEFFVQRAEEALDGEIVDDFQGHGDWWWAIP